MQRSMAPDSEQSRQIPSTKLVAWSTWAYRLNEMHPHRFSKYMLWYVVIKAHWKFDFKVDRKQLLEKGRRGGNSRYCSRTLSYYWFKASLRHALLRSPWIADRARDKWLRVTPALLHALCHDAIVWFGSLIFFNNLFQTPEQAPGSDSCCDADVGRKMCSDLIAYLCDVGKGRAVSLEAQTAKCKVVI